MSKIVTRQVCSCRQTNNEIKNPHLYHQPGPTAARGVVFGSSGFRFAPAGDHDLFRVSSRIIALKVMNQARRAM